MIIQTQRGIIFQMHGEQGERVSEVQVRCMNPYYASVTLMEDVSWEIFKFWIKDVEALSEDRSDFVVG